MAAGWMSWNLVVTLNENQWINILFNIIEILKKLKKLNKVELRILIRTLTLGK